MTKNEIWVGEMCQNLFKHGKVYRKQHMGNTMENEIK
jgi:hypothetical protein